MDCGFIEMGDIGMKDIIGLAFPRETVERKLLPLKENLNKPIKDCEPDSDNGETYLEFIIWGYESIGCPLSKKQIEYLKTDATNEELNDVLDEIDYLVSK